MSDEQYWDPNHPNAHYQETPTTTAGNPSGWSVSPWDMNAIKQYSQPQLQPAYASNMTGNSSYSGSVPGQFLQLPPSDSRPMMSTPSPGVSYDQQPTQGEYSASGSALIHIPQHPLSVNEAAMVPKAPQTSTPRRPKRQASLAGPTSSQRQDRCSKPLPSGVSRKASEVKGTSHKPTQRETTQALTRSPLTMENLAMLYGTRAEEEPPTFRADVSAFRQTEVHQWTNPELKWLKRAASRFIDDIIWLSDGKKNHLKHLTNHQIDTLKKSHPEFKVQDGQVGSLITTCHPDGPDSRYEWKLSDAPGSVFRPADERDTDEARWGARATLHHGAIALVSFGVSSILSKPPNLRVGDWAQRSLKQIEDGVRGIYQAAQEAMSTWPTRAVRIHPDGTQGAATLESRAWWFGAEHEDPSYGGQGHTAAWEVRDSRGFVAESSPQAPVTRPPVPAELRMLREPKVPERMPWESHPGQ